MSQVVIVTGASSGIGASTARMLGAAGASVVINYRSSADLAEAVAAEVRTAGGQAITVAADMGSEADIVRMFEETDRAFGPITGLVNNAAINSPTHRSMETYTFDEIMAILAVNTAGLLVCCREAVKRMSTKHGGKGGVIVNISSVAAKLGAPNTYVDYAASKGAIDSFTVGLGYEVAAEGIRVAGIRPGLIDTEIHAAGGEPDRAHRLAHMVPMKRVGQAEEIANAIVWLMSDEASYVTSTTFDVSGGR